MQKKFYAWIISCLTVLSLSGCGSLQLNLKDGTAKLNACEGATFQLIIHQDPTFNRSVIGKVNSGTVRFDSSELKVFNFKKPVTLTLLLKHLPQNSECSIAQKDIYKAEEIILRAIGDQQYEVDFSAFNS